MNCSFCGEICRCDSEPLPSILAQSQPDCEDAAAPQRAAGLSAAGGAKTGSTEAFRPPENELPEDPAAWRDELSLRFNRYRARRKMRPPRYPSLRLPFDVESSSPVSASLPTGPSPTFEAPYSEHALALNGMVESPLPAEVQDAPAGETAQEGNPQAEAATKTAKIIEFPRFAWAPPPPPPDQLAEPVSERPRILEAPELVPAAPALGGITIEAAERQQTEKRPGIDVPLQSASSSLPRRALASLVDGIIVAVASGLFGFIFWKVVAVRPPLVQMLGLAAGIPGLLWVFYQYLLIVYAATTPGLRVAGLELARFDGTATSQRVRRWRVLGACLSGVSLGMGYAWVFLDEDALCWHDRITHTYLAPVKSR